MVPGLSVTGAEPDAEPGAAPLGELPPDPLVVLVDGEFELLVHAATETETAVRAMAMASLRLRGMLVLPVERCRVRKWTHCCSSFENSVVVECIE
jgi:hypothetical protein